MRRSFLFSLILSTLFRLGCSQHDNPTSSSVGLLPQLVGNWSATKIEFTNKADSSKIDLVPLGGSLELSISAVARFRFMLTVPAGDPQSEEGIITVHGDELRTIPDGNANAETFRYGIAGDTLVIINENETFDVNRDGSEEAVVLFLVFRRKA